MWVDKVLHFLVYWWLVMGGLGMVSTAAFYIYRGVKIRKKRKIDYDRKSNS